jgi:hypothetical protein
VGSSTYVWSLLGRLKNIKTNAKGGQDDEKDDGDNDNYDDREEKFNDW